MVWAGVAGHADQADGIGRGSTDHDRVIICPKVEQSVRAEPITLHMNSAGKVAGQTGRVCLLGIDSAINGVVLHGELSIIAKGAMADRNPSRDWCFRVDAAAFCTVPERVATRSTGIIRTADKAARAINIKR